MGCSVFPFRRGVNAAGINPASPAFKAAPEGSRRMPDMMLNNVQNDAQPEHPDTKAQRDNQDHPTA
jgi:hypothetical protein